MQPPEAVVSFYKELDQCIPDIVVYWTFVLSKMEEATVEDVIRQFIDTWTGANNTFRVHFMQSSLCFFDAPCLFSIPIKELPYFGNMCERTAAIMRFDNFDKHPMSGPDREKRQLCLYKFKWGHLVDIHAMVRKILNCFKTHLRTIKPHLEEEYWKYRLYVLSKEDISTFTKEVL
jgi:hypothetical protein